jgi:prepilin-type N-terminal cleavage/methylation domain-containing protein/prepilin-type processing-associated H-X9-DG protein
MVHSPSFCRRERTAGFTLMEVLVVVAIILVLAAIAFPVYKAIMQRAHKTVALNTMKQLASGTQSYIAQNDGTLPEEDAKGADTWQSAADPENAKAWYNSLPKILSARPVSEFAGNPREFYTKDSLFFLPGAEYPEGDKRLRAPLFAIAINTKLQRKIGGEAKSAKLSQITNPAKTVLFLEKGLPSEKPTAEVQTKADFDGAPKGSAKSFIGRYGGKGILMFVDGHVEEWAPKDTLTETGSFPFPQTEIVWTRDPSEDPNKK